MSLNDVISQYEEELMVFDIVKNNQAGCAYLEGLMDSRKYSNYPEIEDYIRQKVLGSKCNNKVICFPAMSGLIDILEEKNNLLKLICKITYLSKISAIN